MDFGFMIGKFFAKVVDLFATLGHNIPTELIKRN